MTTHELLVAARNLIEREGWHQGSWGSRGVGFCLRGATGEVVYDDPVCDARLDALDLLGRLVGGTSGDVHRWNDTPGRTKKEALALFDKAIAQTAPEPDVSFVKDEESACVV